MSISNKKIRNRNFLDGMYRDGYFPNFLVDKIKEILVQMCVEIERKRPAGSAELFEITHSAVEGINQLQAEFEENNSELETVAREEMGEEFDFIVKAYGFPDLDIEDVIEPRDW